MVSLEVDMDPSINVYGKPLRICCNSPVTGYFRNGCCDTRDDDHGVHTICVIATNEFLEFSKERGNDLSTPIPEYNFSGVKEGDKWCLCAARWLEAHEAGKAPKIVISATHKRTLEIVPLEILESYAVDL